MRQMRQMRQRRRRLRWRPLLGRFWRRRLVSRTHVEVIDASWHVDADAICPDCLQWINPWDFVRRNAFDLIEHEVCPPVVVRHARR